jgi:micrococcal nuclease
LLAWVTGAGISIAAADESGRVTAVFDGDTIRVSLESGISDTVRLIGIDCLETDDEREPVRLSALFAKRYTFLHLFGRRVRLSFDWERRDRYGRMLAYIHLEGGNFNQRILEDGFASPFLKFPFRRDYQETFVEAAKRARGLERGLWRPEPYPVLAPERALDSAGLLASVRFRCAEIRRWRSLIFLVPASGAFSAFIQRRDAAAFGDLEALIGREILVSGLIEVYQGQPRILLFLPRQISDPG